MLLAGGIALVFLIPPAVRWGLEKWLESQGPISAKVDDVEFNPLTGTLVIHTFLAERETTPGKMQVQRASVVLEWWPLWKQHLMLDRLAVRNAVVTVRQAGSDWYVGGLKITPFNMQKSSWQVGFGDIDLENVQVRLLDGQEQKTFTIPSAHVDAMQEWNPEQSGTFDLRLQIAGSSVELRGQASPFAAQPALDAKLRIDSFPLPWLQTWLAPRQMTVQEGTFSAEVDIAGRYQAPEERLRLSLDGSLGLQRLQAALAGDQVRLASLSWRGSLALSAPRPNRPPLVTAKGELAAGALELQLASPALQAQLSSLNFRHDFAMGTAEVPPGAPFILQAALEARQVAADDTARGLALARLESLELKDLRLQGRDALQAGSLHAAGLQALQRPAAGTGPAYLLTLADLLAQEVRAAKAGEVEAQKIALSGLEAHLARDAQGGLDLGPWRPASAGPGGGGQKAGGGKFSYRFGQIDLDKGRLVFVDRTLPKTPQLEVAPIRAHLENVDSGGGGQPATFAVDLQVNGHAIALRGQGEPFAPEPAVRAHLQTSGFPLGTILPYIQTGQARIESGLLDLDSDLGLHYRPADGQLQLEMDGSAGMKSLRGTLGQVRLAQINLGWQGQMRMSAGPGKTAATALTARGRLDAGPLQVGLSAPALNLRLRRLQVEGNFAQGTAEVPAGAPFLMQGKASLKGLQADDPKKKLNLARLASLEVTGAEVRGPQQIALQSLRAGGLQALEYPAAGTKGAAPGPHLIAADQLALARVQTRENGQVAVGEARLTGFDGRVLRRADGQLAIAPWLEGGKAPQKGPAEQPGGREIAFRIDRVKLDGRNRLSFTDLSVKPTVHLRLAPLEAQAGALDSAAPGQSSPIRLAGQFGKYTSLQIDGTVQAFAPQPTMDLKLELKGFNLAKVTAYPERFIGYRVQSGNLDLQADVRIAQGQLDSTARLKLVKLDLKPLTAEEKSQTTQELGFPLNAGLSSLRDRNGDIRLTFPVTGDLQNPHIGLAGIIRKATFKALRRSVLTYFSPIGAVATMGGKLLFHRIFHLRFDPAYFPPGETQLSPQNRKYLQEVAGRLQDRPKVTLLLCGVAVPADLNAAQGAGGGEAAKEKGLRLARQRSEAVKDYLVGQGIDNERLVFCAPEMDEDPQAKPRVEIGI